MIYKITIIGLSIAGWLLFSLSLIHLYQYKYTASIAYGVASIASFVIRKAGQEEYDKNHD